MKSKGKGKGKGKDSLSSYRKYENILINSGLKPNYLALLNFT